MLPHPKNSRILQREAALGHRIAIKSIAVALAFCAAAPAFAWVYPEHRDIALLAIETLDPERKAIFDRLWSDARGNQEARLCAIGADVAQGLTPECIDWAAMSAIAGDHSCSSQQMLDTILTSESILRVAAVAAQLKADLANISSSHQAVASQSDGLIGDLRVQIELEAVRAEQVNALRASDARLQSADSDYATRAQSNNAHFLLARPTVDFSIAEYMDSTVRVGSEVNALGVWGRYHLSALQKASRLAHENNLTGDERTALARAALADEGFALHFLEDVFAAGHVAGTWGDMSQRKGTHDYYNAHGLEVRTWQGGENTVVLMGDAHMRPEDARRAAEAARLSLEQLLDIANGRPRKNDLPHSSTAPAHPEAFDICANDLLGEWPTGQEPVPNAMRLGLEVLLLTPVPSLREGLGAMPRFRSELGPFIGAAGSLNARHINGGFTGLESGDGFVGGADLSLRFGYGLEGVLGEEGDGLVYFSFGYGGDTPSTNKFSEAAANESSSYTTAIPGRTGYTVRLRMPFYLVPGDLLFLSPVYLASPKAYERMGVTAVNGGLIPWQLAWATRFGRFQFVLGREISATFYGVGSDDSLVAPSQPPDAGLRVIKYASTYFELPILEYRPYRAFDTTQTSELIVQLFAGVDIPNKGKVVFPAGAQAVELDNVYSIGVRVVFDWRRYF
jgi:hypothetical protein